MKQESDKLKMCLQKAQDKITMLLEEKRKLLEKVKVRGLQVRIIIARIVMDVSETNFFSLEIFNKRRWCPASEV